MAVRMPSPQQLWRTLDSRLQLHHFSYAIPRHANTLPFLFGGIAVALFIIEIVTGIVMTSWWGPLPIGDEKPLAARVMRKFHLLTMAAVLLFIGLHLLRVYVTAAHRRPREVNWMIGVVAGHLMVLEAASARLLIWSKRFPVEEEARPLLDPVRDIFGGWFTGLAGSPLNYRAYDAHISILPILLGIVLVAHFHLIRAHGLSRPWWVRENGPESTLPFSTHLFAVARWTVLVLVAILPVAWWWATRPEGSRESVEVYLTTFPVYWAYAMADWFGGRGVFWASISVLLTALLMPFFVDRGPQTDIRRRPAAVALLAVAIVGFGVISGIGHRELGNALAQVREAVAERPGPGPGAPPTLVTPSPIATPTPATVPRGAALFAQSCAGCHGETAAGTDRAGPLRTLRDLGFFLERWQVTHTRGGAAFANFSEEDRKTLWDWLQSLR